MMNKITLLLAAATVATSLSAVECQTVRLVDVERELSDYVGATNAAGVACAEWSRLERDWRAALSYDEKTRELSVRMCPFRCWGNILALNDSLPYVSLEAVGATRDAYSLAWIRPGEEVTYRARVYNPSPKPLAGAVELRLPDGWFYDRGSVDVGTVPAFGASDAVTFRVKAPAFNSCRKLEPVNAIFRGAGVKSSPAVEMVWFQKEPQLKAKPEFGVR